MDISVVPLRRPSRNFPRGKNGCLTCRNRKKKCDEAKPKCAGCLRSNVICRWPKLESIDNEIPSALEPLERRTHCHGNERRNREMEHTATWNQLNTAFLNNERPCFLTRLSSNLLEHYFTRTAILLLPPTSVCQNPFVRLILPIAFCDDLVMHAILALSGVHQLGHNHTNSVAIQRATWTHYAIVIRSLQVEVLDGENLSSDSNKILRLLVVLIIVCHVEAIGGDTNGAMFHHLRASRQLISYLRTRPFDTLPSDFKPIFGFTLELYAYLVIANTFTPHGIVEQRTVPLDSFLRSLKDLAEFDTFGVMFGGIHSLLELIPVISVLFAQRLREDSQVDSTRAFENTRSASPQSIEMYRAIRGRIRNWRLPLLCSSSEQGNGSTHGPTNYGQHKEKQLIGEIYRHALDIYLTTSMAGRYCSEWDCFDELQKHATAILDLAPLLEESYFDYTILWPVIICGSCLTDQSCQSRILNGLLFSRYHMGHIKIASQLLQKLWADPGAYGPYGLYRTMEKHNIIFCSL